MSTRTLSKSNSERVTNLDLFRFIVRHKEWQTVFDHMSADALNLAVDEAATEMSLDQLAYVLKRLARHIRPRRSVSDSRRSASSVFVVYWLYLSTAPDVPVYVGQTRKLSERWNAHLQGCSATSLISDRSLLRIKVVDTVIGTQRDAVRMEKKHILEALKLNCALLNRKVQ